MRLILSRPEVAAYQQQVRDAAVIFGRLDSDAARMRLPDRMQFARPRTKRSLIRVLDRADCRVAVGLGERYERDYWRRIPRRRHERSV